MMNDKGQIGVIFIVLFGLFIIGIAWVFMGGIMQEVQDANNVLISDPNMHYTDRHLEGIDSAFSYWWALPIYFILLFVIYGIKQSMEKDTGVE